MSFTAAQTFAFFFMMKTVSALIGLPVFLLKYLQNMIDASIPFADFDLNIVVEFSPSEGFSNLSEQTVKNASVAMVNNIIIFLWIILSKSYHTNNWIFTAALKFKEPV